MADQVFTIRNAVLAMSVLALAGCETLGNPLAAFGKRKEGPDEFQVVARAPLRMPSNRSLPEPRLGEASPLEPNPNRAAIEALMGTGTAQASGPVSNGEQALLTAANASASSPEIRAALAEDLDNYEEPYETPTIFELFQDDDAKPPKDAIDASVEARRLQTEGIAAAPIDPNDKPADNDPDAAVREDPDTDDTYGTTSDRRPSNKLPSASKPLFD